MTAAVAFRGQPLLLLGGILLTWVGLRVALWQPPFDERRNVPPISRHDVSLPIATTRAELPKTPLLAMPRPASVRAPAVATFATIASPGVVIPRGAMQLDGAVLPGLGRAELAPLLGLRTQSQSVRASMPGVPAAAPTIDAANRPLGVPRSSRWSADAWVMLRDDTTTPILSGRPSYGRSQAGAVMRYRLARSSSHAPQAYSRVSKALAGARERELAIGLSARPVPRLPVRVALEGRVGETDRGTEVRPAAFAVTELPPLALPLGASAEVYLEGGYVGGHFATAFVDGQARVERPLLEAGDVELRVGGGAWGGAQEGAKRLDVGPTVSAAFHLGPAYGRVAADYRLRVAGNAEPSSGPALTLSAGF